MILMSSSDLLLNWLHNIRIYAINDNITQTTNEIIPTDNIIIDSTVSPHTTTPSIYSDPINFEVANMKYHTINTIDNTSSNILIIPNVKIFLDRLYSLLIWYSYWFLLRILL